MRSTGCLRRRCLRESSRTGHQIREGRHQSQSPLDVVYFFLMHTGIWYSRFSGFFFNIRLVYYDLVRYPSPAIRPVASRLTQNKVQEYLLTYLLHESCSPEVNSSSTTLRLAKNTSLYSSMPDSLFLYLLHLDSTEELPITGSTLTHNDAFNFKKREHVHDNSIDPF
jgi:hypothetical protein